MRDTHLASSALQENEDFCCVEYLDEDSVGQMMDEIGQGKNDERFQLRE